MCELCTVVASNSFRVGGTLDGVADPFEQDIKKSMGNNVMQVLQLRPTESSEHLRPCGAAKPAPQVA